MKLCPEMMPLVRKGDAALPTPGSRGLPVRPRCGKHGGTRSDFRSHVVLKPMSTIRPGMTSNAASVVDFVESSSGNRAK